MYEKHFLLFNPIFSLGYQQFLRHHQKESNIFNILQHIFILFSQIKLMIIYLNFMLLLN